MSVDGEMPFVTTVVTSCNHVKYVREAVDSALRQTGPFRHEILLFDDGSTDGTADVMAEYAVRFPAMIRDMSTKSNRGISENMKACFAAARGEYVAVLEGDDYWSDIHKLATQVDFLRKHPSAPMVFSRSGICDQDGKGLRFARIQEGLPELLSGRDIFNAGSSSVIINFSSCMFRRIALQNLPEVLWEHRLSELALCFHLERSGPIGYIGKPMSVYRQHASGTFTGNGAVGRLRQEIACRMAARCVCAPAYVDDFSREIASREEELSLRLECEVATGMCRIRQAFVIGIHSLLKCLRENGLKYTLRRIFLGRRY